MKPSTLLKYITVGGLLLFAAVKRHEVRHLIGTPAAMLGGAGEVSREVLELYQTHQKTAQALVAHAYRHDIPVNSDLVIALDEPVTDRRDQSFVTKQWTIAERTRELISRLDESLGNEDSEFKKLFRQFESEETSLKRLGRPEASSPDSSHALNP